MTTTLHTCRILILCLVCLCNGSFQRLTASPGFSFSGQSTLTGHYSSHQPFGHTVPAEYLSWQARGRLTLFHLPLSVSSVLSTQQDSRAQRMNHVSVSLDTRALLRTIDTTGRLGFLRGIQTLEAGRTRPQYASLMLQGVTVDGVNLSVQARGIHGAFVYGNSKRAVGRGVYLQQQHEQRMLYGRFGVGYKERTFLFLSLLHARDDAESIEPDGKYYHWPADTLIPHLDTLFIQADSARVFRKPGEVLIPGIELGTNLFGRRLSIGGEVAGMINTANNESDPVDGGIVPEWVNQIHPVRLSTSLSYAYAITTELRLSTTRLQATYRHIEPGYSSPGTPFMRQDQRSFSVRASQTLWNRRLTLQPHYRRMDNNLLSQHRNTTHTTVWGISATLRPTDLPWLSLSFSPHRQEMDDDTHPVKNKAEVITLSSGMNYLLQEQIHASTSLSWSHQQTAIRHGQDERSLTGNNISLQQSLRFPVPLQLVANAGLYFLENEETTSTSYQVMFRGNYHVSEQWMVSVGARHFNQGGERKRWSARLETSYDFGPYGKVQLLAEPVYYRDLLNPEREYDQYVLRLQFINTW